MNAKTILEGWGKTSRSGAGRLFIPGKGTFEVVKVKA